jgi:hypothetical protein
MEFVDGLSLKQLIDQEKRLPFTVAVSIIRFVCKALHYAHNQVFTLYGKSYEGIVHRDIKPANILLTREGIPKLADFGIAKPTDISLHTVGQKVMGTFTYLSPEQLNGEPLDRRSDIYSLGIVLYECITGEKAFPQKTLADLIREKLRNQYRSIDSFGIEIPKKLEQIIDKSMEINRDKRYENAEEFGNELYDVLKKTTEETPERILSIHLSGQLDTIILKPGKKSRRLPAILFGSLFLVFAVVCAVLVADVLKVKRSQTHAAPDVVKIKPAGHGQTDTALPGAAIPRPALPSQAPQDQRLPVREKQDAGSTGGNAPATEKTVQTDPVTAGLDAYKLQRYSEAIPLLESGLHKTLSDSLRRCVTVFLLESYLSVNNISGAQRIVESTSINDGYFFLLAGRAYHRLGRLQPAIDALCKAQTTPSVFKKDLRKESTFLWARATEEAYASKPNTDNKQRAVRAWQQFQSAFCSGSFLTGQCSEAREHLKNLIE